MTLRYIIMMNYAIDIRYRDANYGADAPS